MSDKDTANYFWVDASSDPLTYLSHHGGALSRLSSVQEGTEYIALVLF